MQYVYAFEVGSKDQKYLLGGKGANLAEMTRLGLPVPPGFTISTDACNAYLDRGRFPDGLDDQIALARRALEAKMGRVLGDDADPLLVSVRSGAAFSMPGMMDTVLNLGLNDESVGGLAAQTGDERFAFDSYRRFVQMFAKIVLGADGDAFESALTDAIRRDGADNEAALSAEALRALVGEFKAIAARGSNTDFPDDPSEQLRLAVEAVFESWNGKRARDYRRHEGIPDDLGTAVNVQAMVFGNKGDDSGTGVAFTRDPTTGERVAYGDFLRNAQGEDVVAGIRLTAPLAEMAIDFGACHRELLGHMATLETHYRDLCDIEFTVEQGQLFILQTRVAKRAAAAALRIAVEMKREGLIDTAEEVRRVRPEQLDQLLHPQFDPAVAIEVLTTGLNASPGAAVGAVYFTADEAEAAAASGQSVILVRPETSPDDLHGMIAAVGILTSRGGLVSHAAVVARGMGRPAVCGADAVVVDLEAKQFHVGDVVVREGEVISISGTTGEVARGEVALVVPEPTGGDFAELLADADTFRRLEVRANADLPDDARRARAFGAQGIGLCRTEHMFLGDRLPIVQRMILAEDPEEEAAALEELGALQYDDFMAILQVMDGLPVTVRLLDPPLHEFLPDYEELLVRRARGELDARGERLLVAAKAWREENPMLGARGCRLGIIKPGLYRMQTRSLFRAAAARQAAGGDPRVEVMIPLIVSRRELDLMVAWVREAVDAELAAAGATLEYHVGTMIETPRAALRAGEIAARAEFFSFGTNDLTQMTYGFSRDDVETRVIPAYLANGLLLNSPFQTLDRVGVGELVQIATERGRAARPSLMLGICGEHGGDPRSIEFCEELGLDYVSCSAFRVPVARLAAAHAALAAAAASAPSDDDA